MWSRDCCWRTGRVANLRGVHRGLDTILEFLEPLGVSQVEAADRMTIPFQRLNAIVKGRRAVSADTALLLEALGRADLAYAAGQVGPLARVEGARASTEGPTAAQVRIVRNRRSRRVHEPLAEIVRQP